MAWTYLLVAGVLEVLWAFAMKKSAGFTVLGPTILTFVAMIASVALLSMAMRSLPLGTAYAVWTGIGAAGAFLAGAVFLGEALTLTRVAAALLIVAGIMLMKLSGGE